MEINLNLDENGRTTFDPSFASSSSSTTTACSSGTTHLDYSTKTVTLQSLLSSITAIHDSEIKPSSNLLHELIHDCEKLVDSTLPFTHWMPCNATPRFALEKLAQLIFHHHTPTGYVYDPNVSGAEYWVQWRPAPPKSCMQQSHTLSEQEQQHENLKDCTKETDGTKQSIPFHWDKDEDLRVATGGLFIHPHISTVTYLSSAGAPTMVLNSRVGNIQSGEPNFDETIDSAFVSWPAIGKHLSFDGAFLHGVPSELLPISDDTWMQDQQQQHQQQEQLQLLKSSSEKIPFHSSQVDTLPSIPQRLTFLVNVWLNYRPLNIHIFPQESIKAFVSPHQLNDTLDVIPINPSNTLEIYLNPEEQEEAKQYDPNTTNTQRSINKMLEWSLGGPVILQAKVPFQDIQQQQKQGGNVSIRWHEKNATRIIVRNTNELES